MKWQGRNPLGPQINGTQTNLVIVTSLNLKKYINPLEYWIQLELESIFNSELNSNSNLSKMSSKYFTYYSTYDYNVQLEAKSKKVKNEGRSTKRQGEEQ